MPAVLAVPSRFSSSQRAALRTAAQAARWQVLDTVDEPVAAAVAFDVLRDASAGKTMVIDVGGGTTDAAVLTLAAGQPGDLRRLSVLSSIGGDVGGDDFDQLLFRHLAHGFHKETGVDPLQWPVSARLLQQACESAKIALDTSDDAQINLPHFVMEVKTCNLVPLNFLLTKDLFLSLCAPLHAKWTALLESALDSARCVRGDIAGVYMVGEMTRSPLVSDFINSFFGRDVIVSVPDVSPGHAVALGAAQCAFSSHVPQQKRSIWQRLGSTLRSDVGASAASVADIQPELDTYWQYDARYYRNQNALNLANQYYRAAEEYRLGGVPRQSTSSEQWESAVSRRRKTLGHKPLTGRDSDAATDPWPEPRRLQPEILRSGGRIGQPSMVPSSTTASVDSPGSSEALTSEGKRNMVAHIQSSFQSALGEEFVQGLRPRRAMPDREFLDSHNDGYSPSPSQPVQRHLPHQDMQSAVQGLDMASVNQTTMAPDHDWRQRLAEVRQSPVIPPLDAEDAGLWTRPSSGTIEWTNVLSDNVRDASLTAQQFSPSASVTANHSINATPPVPPAPVQSQASHLVKPTSIPISHISLTADSPQQQASDLGPPSLISSPSSAAQPNGENPADLFLRLSGSAGTKKSPAPKLETFSSPIPPSEYEVSAPSQPEPIPDDEPSHQGRYRSPKSNPEYPVVPGLSPPPPRDDPSMSADWAVQDPELDVMLESQRFWMWCVQEKLKKNEPEDYTGRSLLDDLLCATRALRDYLMAAKDATIPQLPLIPDNIPSGGM
eukprot:gene9752-1756_t